MTDSMLDTFVITGDIHARPAHSQWQSDNTTILPELHERKWTLDSLCYAIMVFGRIVAIAGPLIRND
ncbi:glycoside hydrolase family 125 protein [Iodobacter ciconiae]|nr:glycoside hydrolase family 125 protein [Iodobacter ciconiae]